MCCPLERHLFRREFEASTTTPVIFLNSFSESRQRQAALAKERLEARKTRRKVKEAIAALTDPAKILEKLHKLTSETSKGGFVISLLTLLGKYSMASEYVSWETVFGNSK